MNKLLKLASVLTLGLLATQASAQTTPIAPTKTVPAAGTQIKNVATFEYTDPNDPTGTKKIPGKSNEVITTIKAVPMFTITKDDEGTTGVENPDFTKPGQANGNADPGETVAFPYTITNTGNTNIIVELDPNSPKAKNGAVTNIKYYLVDDKGNKVRELTDTDGDGKVETPNIPINGNVKIIQEYTIPTTAKDKDEFGANPVGTGVYDKTNPGAPLTDVTAGKNPIETGGKEHIDANNANKTVVSIGGFTPGVPPFDPKNPGTPPPTTPTNPPVFPPIPTNPGDPIDPVDPKNPPTGTTPPPYVVVPPTGIVTIPPTIPGRPPTDGPDNPGNGTPNKPVTPDETPDPNDPNKEIPFKPGYKTKVPPKDPKTTPDPKDPTVNITIIDGSKQIAYPPADKDNDPDQVFFVNTITNEGSKPTKVTITPPDNDTVLTDLNGNPLVDEDPSTPGTQITLPPGKIYYFGTKVKYPDDDNTGIPRKPIEKVITVTDVKDPTKTAKVTNIIHPPAMQFGDTTAPLGTSPDPTPAETVVLDHTKPGTGFNMEGDKGVDTRAVFDMDITNTGAYNDTYYLEGEVDFDGTKVPVKYYYPDGTEVAKDSNGKYITKVVGAGEELKLKAVVDIPNTITKLNKKEYVVKQKAKAIYAGIELEDNNDKIVIDDQKGELNLAKFIKGAQNQTPIKGIQNPDGYGHGDHEAENGEVIEYRLVIQNDYNVAVKGFKICDAVPVGTTFKSLDHSNIPDTKKFYKNGVLVNSADDFAGSLEGTEICVETDATLESGAAKKKYLDFNVTINK